MRNLAASIVIFIVLTSINLSSAYPGNCIRFSGENEYLILDSDRLNEKSDWTFSAWFKNEGSGEQMIYSEGNQQVTCMIKLLDDNRVSAGIFNRGHWQHFYTKNNAFKNGLWYHLAVTLQDAGDDGESGEINIYLNSKLISTGKTFRIYNPPTSLAAIGRNVGSLNGGGQAARVYKGFLDEMTFWDRALSSGEIKKLMVQPPDISAQSLINYWTFDETENGALTDAKSGAKAEAHNLADNSRFWVGYPEFGRS
jgi:hypothetical protein